MTTGTRRINVFKGVDLHIIPNYEENSFEIWIYNTIKERKKLVALQANSGQVIEIIEKIKETKTQLAQKT